jgi:NAD(P)-dependent dehydrogenase (short-subunit alcohol dehydrogenase family)
MGEMGGTPTALITGVSRGLGKELARQYAADGWKVIGTERGEGVQYPLDVRNYQEVAQLKKKLKGEPIDLLFCNAGISGKKGMAPGSFDFGSWEEVLRVNLLGPAALAEALIDNVAASERRTIAMMSSRLGSISESSGMTLPYSTSKAALNMLVKGLAATLASRNITVVALSPGWVRTDMGGEGAPLSPEASVRGLRKVIAGLKPADSGKFFSHDGSAIPW